MPVRRFSTITPARFEAHGRLPHKSTGPIVVRPPEMPKNSFFVTFKAGMLLKTHESQTKCTALERLYRRKCEGFCNIRNKLLGFLQGSTQIWSGVCLKGSPPRMRRGGALRAGVVLTREGIALARRRGVFPPPGKGEGKLAAGNKTTLRLAQGRLQRSALFTLPACRRISG